MYDDTSREIANTASRSEFRAVSFYSILSRRTMVNAMHKTQSASCQTREAPFPRNLKFQNGQDVKIIIIEDPVA